METFYLVLEFIVLGATVHFFCQLNQEVRNLQRIVSELKPAEVVKERPAQVRVVSLQNLIDSLDPNRKVH